MRGARSLKSGAGATLQRLSVTILWTPPRLPTSSRSTHRPAEARGRRGRLR
jgi:hypothetical protein